MPLKNRYAYNRQSMTLGQMFRLHPLGYMEVLPGETLDGRITVDSFSAPVARNAMNRVYSDLYAFYVPFRLLWDEWQNFITQNDSTAVVPLVDDLAPVNFENRFTISSLGDNNPGDRNTAWKRRAYQIVHQKFFALDDSWDEIYENGTVDNWSYRNVRPRPSTWEQALPPQETPSRTITAPTDVDTIRDAFARDQWDKMRDFYGSRYTDYMRALGVQTPWTLNEEPEVLGKKSGDWGFKMISNMTSDPIASTDPLGSNAGFFHNKGIVDIRRKFIPEHGLVAVFSVTRTDAWLGISPTEVMDAKDELEDYWSPEFEMQKQRKYSNGILGGGDIEHSVYRLPYDEYRRGMNVNLELETFNADEVMSLKTDGPASSMQNPSNYNDNFLSILAPIPEGNGLQAHYQATAEWRISRRSPLIRQGQSKPIH